MAEDLMQTQTAGPGDTTQAAMTAPETPDQFTVKLPLAVDSSVAPVEAQAVPTEPVVPVAPTEVSQGQEVPVPEPLNTLSVDFTGAEPIVNQDSLSFNNVDLLAQEAPTDDTPMFEFPEGFDPGHLPEPAPVVESPDFDSADLMDQDMDSDFAKSALSTAGIAPPVANPEPTEYDQNGTIKQEPSKPVDFNSADPFKDIYATEDGLTQYENNPYSVGDVETYQPSVVASKNFVNGYAKIQGLDLEEVQQLNEKAVGSEYSQIDKLSSLTGDLSFNQSAIQAIDNAIATGDYSEVGFYGISEGLGQDKFGSDEKSNQVNANKLKRIFASDTEKIKADIDDINNPSSDKQNDKLSAYDQYDKGITEDIRKAKTWAKDKGIDPSLFDWLNSESGYRYLVKNSLSGSGEKYTPGGVLNYKLSSLTDKLTDSERNQVIALGSRIYQQELNDYFEETGQGDYLSYSGYLLESKQLTAEDHKKLLAARDNVTKQVVPKYEKNMSDWESKNDAILNQRVNDIKGKADDIYKQGIQSVSENDPSVSAVMDEYRQRLSTIQDPEERKLVMTEFENKLFENKAIKTLKEKRDAAVTAASNRELSSYMERKAIFAESNYSNAKKEFHDEFKKATYSVYRQGLNGDVNMYAKMDEISRSPQFRKADFWKKREIIQGQWEKESKDLGKYLLGKEEYYPANKEEQSKHFTEWTGRRPKSQEMIAQHKNEYNQRVGRQAKERYLFYAVDELLDDPSGKATPYMHKSMAKDELAKLDLWEKEYDEMVFRGKGGVNVIMDPKEKQKNYQAREMWTEVLNHDENDASWWNDLGKGFSENLGIPIISSLIGMSKQANLNEAAINYKNGHMSMSEIKLVHANASLNQLKQIKPPSTAYNVGATLGATVEMVGDILLTGGVYRVSSAAAKKTIDSAVTASVKGLYSSADDAFTSYALDVLSNPKVTEKIQNIVGLVAGTFGQTVAMSGDVLEMASKRMAPEMIASYGGVYDPLLVQIEKNSESSAEAVLKSFGVTWANLAIERFGGQLGTSEVKQALLREVGSSKFFQQTLVGNWARKQGFKSMDEAVNYINKNNIQFSSLFDEAIVEELILSKNVEALITGDSKMFEYSSDEVVSTILGVGIFSGMMNGYNYTNAKVFTRPTSTDIETQDQAGNKVVTAVGKDTWTQFNTLLGSKDMTLQKIATFLDNKTLPEDQENALLNVYAKVKGEDMRKDPLYQKSKKDFEEKLGEPLDDSGLTEGSVVIMDEKNTETAPEQDQVVPMDESEDIINETTPESATTALDDQQAEESVSEDVKNPEPEQSSADFFESLKQTIEEKAPAESIPENEAPIEYDETVLVDHDNPTIKDSLKVVENATIKEITALPPVQAGRPPRVMEKVDGAWKLKTGDTYSDVSENIQQQAQVQFDSDQSAVQQKAKEKDSEINDRFRDAITNLAEGIKIKDGKLMSGLPIPPAVWNGFVDVVKDFVLKGYDITKALSAARKQYLNEKIKSGEVTRKDAASAGKKIRDMYSDFRKAQPKPNKSVQRKIDADQNINPQPFLRIREKTILEEKIKSYNKGSKSATAELQDIKKQIVDYAKATLPLTDLNKQELKSLLTRVARAKKLESVSEAFTSIDKLVDKYGERDRVQKADEIKKVLTDKKTFIKKVGGKWKGKISTGALKDLNDFVENELPTNIDNLSIQELDFYSDVINGILNEGKMDLKARDQINRIQKRKEDAVIFQALSKDKPQKLSSEEEITSFLEDGGKVVIGDEFISGKTAFAEFKSLHPETEMQANGYILKTAKEQVELSKRKFQKNPLKFITKGGAISNIDNLMLFAYKGSPGLKKFITENITNPIKEGHQNKVNEIHHALKEVIDARQRIFGSQLKANNFLNSYSGVDLIKQFNEKDPDIVTNDMIVSMYAISRTENGVEKLSKTVDVDKLMEYVNKNPNIKEYADFFIDDFLPKMKDEFSPMYQKLYDMEIPEGTYFPTFADNDTITSYDLDGVVNGGEAFNMRSAMASSLKQRVNYTGPVTITKGATSIMNNYINTMYHAKNFMPVAERINQLMSKPNTPEIIAKVGHSVYGNMVQQFDAIINDRRPSIPSEGANKVMNAAIAINTVTTLGNKLSSIPKQSIAALNYAFAGVQDGVYPHDWLAGFIPKSDAEIKTVAKFISSPFMADRWKGGMDMEMRRLTERATKNPTRKIFNEIMKTMMIETRAGDAAAVVIGGYPYLIAQYRKAKRDGMTDEQAYDHAYQKVQIETNLSQQSDAPYAITNSQKKYWFRILFPFRSGQVSYANKTMSGVRKLMDYDNLTTDEKWQAVHDALFFPTASFIFAAVASGLINELYHVYVTGDGDEDKLKKLYYETLKDGAQSNIQGYGVGGGLLDWTANIATDDDWKNNVPVIRYLTEAPKAMADLVSLLSDSKEWDDLTDIEKNRIKQSVGAKNLEKTINSIQDYIEGDKNLYDAIMNYNPDDDPTKDDQIYDLFYGSEGSGSGSGYSSVGEDAIGEMKSDSEVIGGDEAIE